MKLEVRYLSDKGKRATNEDSFLARKIGDVWIQAVADGLGGQAAGEVASKMGLIEIEEFLKGKLSEGAPLSPQLVGEAITKANKEIYLLSKENAAYNGMGSTVVLALVSNGIAIIANVGDSRAYMIGEDIKQITQDHSLINELLASEKITANQAQAHPDKNIVTRVLGVGETVEPDFFNLELGKGIMLLCSDGLSNALTDDEIKKIVISSPDLESACTRLINQANEKGAKDNVTVILARDQKGVPSK